jgi:predicted phosphodiesterase
MAWHFVCAADMQPGHRESFRYRPALVKNWQCAARQIREINPDLVIVPGDVTRDGSLHRFELEEMKADFDGFPFPFHVVAGNMDTGNKHAQVDGRSSPGRTPDPDLNVTSEQLQQFASVFGPLWWSFDHKGVRFSGVTDMIVNSGLPEEEAFWAWAEEQRQRPHATHHVWITHYPLFLDDPDEADWDIENRDQYMDWYFSIDQPGRGKLLQLIKDTGGDIVFSGHVHCYKETVVDGIRFIIAPAICAVQWPDRWPDGQGILGIMRCDVTDDGIETTLIPLEEAHTAKGYGPGGHPAPHLREYGQEWPEE